MFTGVHVPPEILEQILVNLPVKSLLRFSAVSKSWSCMIESRKFIEQHKSLAARERIITLPSHLDHLTGGASVWKISPTPSAVEYLSDLWPIEGTPRLLALCDELWLVGTGNTSLFLWNHSMRSYRKLPVTRRLHWDLSSELFLYGLGYDSAADDYKVLRIYNRETSELEVYSLRSSSWKIIPAMNTRIKQKQLEFVNGAFHWICTYKYCRIISFDLSSEKYGEIALPALDSNGGDTRWVEVVVMRGKLCVSGDNGSRFVLWVMEEYGVEKSWTKKLDIVYSSRIPSIEQRRLRALCYYNNGDVLFNISCKKSNRCLFMYEAKSAQVMKIVAHDNREIYGGFMYVESLVSPWRGLPRINASKEGFHKRIGREQINANKELQRRKVKISDASTMWS